MLSNQCQQIGQPCGLLHLPPELLLDIARRMSYATYAVFRNACRMLRRLFVEKVTDVQLVTEEGMKGCLVITNRRDIWVAVNDYVYGNDLYGCILLHGGLRITHLQDDGFYGEDDDWPQVPGREVTLEAFRKGIIGKPLEHTSIGPALTTYHFGMSAALLFSFADGSEMQIVALEGGDGVHAPSLEISWEGFAHQQPSDFEWLKESSHQCELQG